MNNIKLKLLYITIFFVFTQGMWERILFFVPEVSYIVDIVTLAFILFQFKLNFFVPGIKVFFTLIICSFFIGFVNSDTIVESFLYLRYTLFIYLIYNQLFVHEISLKNWSHIFKFLFIMVLIQGVGALYNLYILGIRVEGHVGLMSSLGGTTATVFPLFVSNLVLLYFLFRPKLSKKTWVVLGLVFMSSFLVAFSSGKRAIYFFIPLFLLINIGLSLPNLIKNKYLKRKILDLSILSVLFFFLIIYGMVNSKGFNYSLYGDETSLEVVRNSVNYAEGYESSTDQFGRTIGRFNTTNKIISKSFSDASFFLSGIGYGATKKDSTKTKLRYGYGIVGFTRDLISGGWILAFMTIVLFFTMILKNKSVRSYLTKTVRRSIFLVFICVHFFYSSDFTVSLKVSLILVIILAFINSPIHSQAMVSIFNKNQLLR